MTKGLRFGRSLRGTLAGRSLGRRRPARLEEPHDATTFVQKPLFRTLRRIPHSDCSTAPAAGYRNTTSGALGNVGTHGWYWASSPFFSGDEQAGHLWLHAGAVKPLDDSQRANALSVRCVQHLRLLFIRLPGPWPEEKPDDLREGAN